MADCSWYALVALRSHKVGTDSPWQVSRYSSSSVYKSQHHISWNSTHGQFGPVASDTHNHLPIQEWGLSFPPQRLELARKSNKLDRFATVEDVIQQVKVFVVSKSVTGQNAIIDAGFTL